MNIKRALPIVMFLVVASALGVYATTAASPSNRQATLDNLTVEIALNPSSFAFTEDRVFEDGLPAYGTSFIVQGYLYPEGTLSEGNGVLADGAPEFPDQLIGDWVCYGWFVGDGLRTETGDVVVTTQIYRLTDEGPDASIVTHGYELADLKSSVARAITGGTGAYAGARGEQLHTTVSFTEVGTTMVAEFRFGAP